MSLRGVDLFLDDCDLGVDILVIMEGWNWGDKMASCIAQDIKEKGAVTKTDRVRELLEMESEADTLSMTP